MRRAAAKVRAAASSAVASVSTPVSLCVHVCMHVCALWKGLGLFCAGCNKPLLPGPLRQMCVYVSCVHRAPATSLALAFVGAAVQKFIYSQICMRIPYMTVCMNLALLKSSYTHRSWCSHYPEPHQVSRTASCYSLLLQPLVTWRVANSDAPRCGLRHHHVVVPHGVVAVGCAARIL
jgi:hypothetical protein